MRSRTVVTEVVRFSTSRETTEPAPTSAKGLQGIRRLAFVALPVLMAVPLWGESACETVPESRRAECEKVLDCMTIEDADVRRVCIDAAQDEEPVVVPQAPAAQQPEPEAQLESEASREPQRALAPDQILKPDPRYETREPPVLEEQTVTLKRQPATSVPTQPQNQNLPELRPPAENFTATVSRIHQSILDRQLIALDNSFLFVSDHASPARLKVGQTVDVERRKSRFRTTRTWLIVGANRHTIEASRIRCEKDGIGADDRRRCEQMLNR